MLTCKISEKLVSCQAFHVEFSNINHFRVSEFPFYLHINVGHCRGVDLLIGRRDVVAVEIFSGRRFRHDHQFLADVGAYDGSHAHAFSVEHVGGEIVQCAALIGVESRVVVVGVEIAYGDIC